jgi:hypothetical protein
MTVKNLFIFGAVVSLGFGLPLIFSPQSLANLVLVDPTLSDGAISTFRNYGMLLTGVAIGTLSSLNARPSIARRGFLILITISAGLNTINLVYAVLSGIGKTSTWGIVLLTGILTLWAFSLLMKEKVAEL